jgi:hypothetical protein
LDEQDVGMSESVEAEIDAMMEIPSQEVSHLDEL